MPRLRVRHIINSTGRRTIRERDVSLTLSLDPAVVRVAELALPSPRDPEDGDAFEEASVWMEAAQPRTASFDRWLLGSVRQVRARRPVSVHELRNFSDASDAVFTVKVVADDGRILASSDDVRPADRRAGEQEALLPVVARPLGDVPWLVELAPDYRTSLIVNSRIPSAEAWIEQDPVASSLVLPGALRSVLLRLLTDTAFKESDWGAAWTAWAARIAPTEMPVEWEVEEGLAWIEQTVEAFCRHHHMLERLARAIETEGAKE